MSTLIADGVAVDFSGFVITGAIHHDDARRGLFLEDSEGPTEVLSTNLAAYGMNPLDGHVFIKDWTEHYGVTAALVAQGVVTIVDEVHVGPFSSRAYQVRVHTAEEAASKRAELKLAGA